MLRPQRDPGRRFRCRCRRAPQLRAALSARAGPGAGAGWGAGGGGREGGGEGAGGRGDAGVACTALSGVQRGQPAADFQRRFRTQPPVAARHGCRPHSLSTCRPHAQSALPHALSCGGSEPATSPPQRGRGPRGAVSRAAAAGAPCIRPAGPGATSGLPGPAARSHTRYTRVSHLPTHAPHAPHAPHAADARHAPHAGRARTGDRAGRVRRTFPAAPLTRGTKRSRVCDARHKRPTEPYLYPVRGRDQGLARGVMRGVTRGWRRRGRRMHRRATAPPSRPRRSATASPPSHTTSAARRLPSVAPTPPPGPRPPAPPPGPATQSPPHPFSRCSRRPRAARRGAVSPPWPAEWSPADGRRDALDKDCRPRATLHPARRLITRSHGPPHGPKSKNVHHVPSSPRIYADSSPRPAAHAPARKGGSPVTPRTDPPLTADPAPTESPAGGTA